VREQGTDALTLGALAERAGVSKPIAYEAFQDPVRPADRAVRPDQRRQVAALVDALERTPRRLEDVARVVARAYMDCYTSIGPECTRSRPR